MMLADQQDMYKAAAKNPPKIVKLIRLLQERSDFARLKQQEDMVQ